MVADLFSLLAQTASPKGEAGKGRIVQTASPKGEAEKRRIAQSASTERKTEKGTKDSRGVGKGKAGKGWCGGWSRPLQSACADSFPEGGSREKANCAERFCREESRERNESQPWRWKVQSRGKGWCGGWSRPLQSACADSFPEGGSRERNDSAACRHKNR